MGDDRPMRSGWRTVWILHFGVMRSFVNAINCDQTTPFRYVRLEIADTAGCEPETAVQEFELLDRSKNNLIQMYANDKSASSFASSSYSFEKALDGNNYGRWWQTAGQVELHDGPLGARSRHWLEVDLGEVNAEKQLFYFDLTTAYNDNADEDLVG